MTNFDSNIFVMGSNGRIGSKFRAFASQNDLKTLVFGQRKLSCCNDLQQLNLDLTSTGIKSTSEKLRDHRIASIIVLSGVVSGTPKDLQQNTEIARNALELARFSGVRRVLFSSTSAVYGNQLDSPYKEQDDPIPINEYGKSKLEMEKFVANSHVDGIETCCLRIGNVLGADSLMGRVFDGAKSITLDVNADGASPLRSYIGIETLIKVMIKLANYPKSLPDILNIANPKPVHMSDFLKAERVEFNTREATSAKNFHITLNCKLLAGMYDFDNEELSPDSMIEQWKRLQ